MFSILNAVEVRVWLISSYSQMLGASYLLHLNSATDDIGVDGPPPSEVGILEGGNSTTIAEIAHRSFP